MNALTIGIVGVTGIVGQTLIDCLQDDDLGFTVEKVLVFASQASQGKRIQFGTKSLRVQDMELSVLLQCHVVFFASDSAISQEWIPQLAAKGVLCIDKSSAYRNHPKVPLVVPEVNGASIDIAQLKEFPVIANPNCCSTPLSLLLKALDQDFSVKQVVVSTYQSVSGAGKPAMEVLREESFKFFSQEDLSNKASLVFPKSIAFNVMPFVAKILPNGDTDEEQKICEETRKILNLPLLPIDATSVRVPTFVGHALSVTVGLGHSPSIAMILKSLSNFEGLCVIDASLVKDEDDDSAHDISDFVTPREAHGKDPVFVSRVRPSKVFPGGANFWLVSDNLRKGAALNAVQILNRCCQKGFFDIPK